MRQDVDGGADQVLGTETHTCVTDGQDLGMCGGVVALRDEIRALGEDLAIPDDHGGERSAAGGDVVSSDVDRALNVVGHGLRI